ncbi:MAG TPA: rhodanese-like domain-containing protein [Candidatus Polarisedimenticolia bacterium]|nr:rhodanese-like domain-containing protein [Candidatus Polarisedimenticolia bacterium]
MNPAQPYRQIEAAEAERLIRSEGVRVLDVRSAEEFTTLGHIPGALLLPVDLIASAPATLKAPDEPILVCCEHGVRSAFAAGWLARAGFARVINLAGGMSTWRGAREHSPAGPASRIGPSAWLLDNADLLPRDGPLLDLACGSGRHALLLSAAGFRVRAIDRDEEKIGRLRDLARRLELAIDAAVVDLERPGLDLGRTGHAAILVFDYLQRPLFPALRDALRPGGVLIYETFTAAQAACGHPTNPEFLLDPGELQRLVQPLEILRQREGETDGRHCAAVVARRAG